MDFAAKIIEQYREDADKKVALVCRIMIEFMVIIVILNLIGVFTIAPLPLYTTAVLSIANFCIPTLLYNFLKVRSTWIRYFILTVILLQCGFFYATLSYHTVMMLAFPVVVSCLYNERKYVIYTLIVSEPVLIISHLIAFQLKIVVDEPLVTLRGVWCYGILPRTIQLFAIGIVCVFISDRIERLIQVLANKNNEVYEDQGMIISSLSEIIEAQSQTTGQHVKRVSEYTAILCRGLGYSDEDTWKVSVAAMMHDVGKIMIPLEILEKPGKLTDKEFERVKLHVAYGKRMLERSHGELMRISMEIAYQHHEKWNGKGYIGLKGEEISPYARCVAVADVFDALVSQRSYKKAWSPQDAYNEIVSQRGEHFAPEVVDVFIKCFDQFLEVMHKFPDQVEHEAS